MTLLKNFISVLLTAAVVLAAFSTFCYADSPAAVSIDGTLELEGGHIYEDDQWFLLSTTGDCPMPGGSSGGVKRSPLLQDGSFSFGEIFYDRPGIYEYTVSREIAPKDDVTMDDSVYKVTVEILSDGTSAVFYQKDGSDGKPDKISYVDRYSPPDKETGEKKSDAESVKTGDTLQLKQCIAIFITALTVLIMCRFFMRKY